MAERRRGLEALSALGPSAQTGHFRGGRGLVEKHQPLRFLAHPGLTVAAPAPAVLDNIPAPGLGRQHGLFLTVKPRASRKRDSEAGWTVTPRSAFSLTASSGMVMAPCFSTQPIKNAACGASLRLSHGIATFLAATTPEWMLMDAG